MPIIDGFDDESIQTIGHLGIVAGAYDSSVSDIVLIGQYPRHGITT